MTPYLICNLVDMNGGSKPLFWALWDPGDKNAQKNSKLAKWSIETRIMKLFMKVDAITLDDQTKNHFSFPGAQKGAQGYFSIKMFKKVKT